MKLVSACLLGVRCRWDGKRRASKKVIKLSEKEILIPVCPEQLGGLPTPRVAQEIVGGSGGDVLDGRCIVLNREGEDVTGNFVRGAREVLRIARLLGVSVFIGKERSPSCASRYIYDGSFKGKLAEGEGVTSALLRRNGIDVLSDEDL